MKNLAKLARSFSPIALISPRHLLAALSRVPECDIFKAAKNASESGKRSESWYETEDYYGQPLPCPCMTAGGVCLIPIKGMITSGLHPIYQAFGYCDTDKIASWLAAAVANPECRAIVLVIDSPGGMCMGTPELAQAVADADQIKPVFAHTSGLCCSAAYYIASQARAVYCTPSADVGSIGVYQMIYGFEGWNEQMGVTAEMIKSGDLKGAGHPDIPLSPDQRSQLQQQVDLIGEQFRAAVTGKRTLVAPDTMRGQSFIGTEAAERNLVAGLRPLSSLLKEFSGPAALPV